MNRQDHKRLKESHIGKPEWLKVKLPDAIKSGSLISVLRDRNLNTICSSGLCPNRGECWCNGTATFMIGGDICTRNCRFCAVTTGRPHYKPDVRELKDIIRTIQDFKIKHAVITSVDRDDLSDGGASHWVELLRLLHEECNGVTVETLIPDFRGKTELIDLIIDERPNVISHNLETVRSLTPHIRSVATYNCSLKVLEHISSRGIRAKSGIMLGLGETEKEVLETMDDLLDVGCEVMTIGQYMQPTASHYPVKEYIRPEKFEEYKIIAMEKGFIHVESSPLVRSSYHAERHIH